MRSFKHDASGFEHIAAVGEVQRFRHALFHQQNGQARAGVDGNDALEYVVGGSRRAVWLRGRGIRSVTTVPL